VVNGSNELAMSESEFNDCAPEELDQRGKKVIERFLKAGADFVIDSLDDMEAVTVHNQFAEL